MKERYVAFLRGINVGGHHKVPMAELRKEMEKLKYENVVTLLNSGNIIFDAIADDLEHHEKRIAEHLEEVFGFPISTILLKSETIYELLSIDPFKDEILTKDMRWYVSFVRRESTADLQLPWASNDGSYRITGYNDKFIFSVIDISISKTPKVMADLERYFGKDITTRNWNTIKRIEKKLEASR